MQLVDKHDSSWDDWLNDEPPAIITPDISYAVARPDEPPVIAAPKEKATIQIDIRMPKFRRLSKPRMPSIAYKKPALPYKKMAITFCGVALLVGVGLGAKGFINNQPTKQATRTSASAAAPVSLDQPNFSVLAPKDKAQLGQQGTANTAFDGTRNAFSFKDTFLGTELTVSQQPLPPKYDSEATAAAKIAETLKAKDPIGTARGTAYVATDARSNSQTVVYATNGVLVFIQSPFKKDNASWKYYLDGLQ